MQAIFSPLEIWEVRSQEVQEVCPVDVETAFPLHTVQLFSDSNFPISQLVHCVAPEVTNSPAAFLASEPGSHWAQLADPAALNVRGGQKSQLKLSVRLPFFPVLYSVYECDIAICFAILTR